MKKGSKIALNPQRRIKTILHQFRDKPAHYVNGLINGSKK